MTTREAHAPKLEHELAVAVDGIFGALADGVCIESDAQTAVRTLETYLAHQNRITAAAERGHNAGLHTACGFLENNLVDLIGRATAVRAEEHALLDMWPAALIEYCADPSSAEATAGLVACLSDSSWSSPLSADEADVLQRMILSAATGQPESDAVLQDTVPETSEPEGNAGTKPQHPAAEASAAANRPSVSGSLLADGSFTRIPHSTRVAWMADLAERKGLIGIQEICERVGHAVSIWEPQDDGISGAQCAYLDQVLGLAKDALGAAYGPALAERLLALLGEPVWPEPLVGDERELVSELLQADVVACDPLSAIPCEEEIPESPSDGPVAADDAPGVTDDTNCNWLHEQIVPDELVALLAGEIDGSREAHQHALDAACAGADGDAREAAEVYADELDRIGAAADAVGLFALHRFLFELKRMFEERADAGLSAQQHDVLTLLSGALAAYLAAPNDPSAAESLVDLLRSNAWVTPLPDGEAARLVRGLGLVKVSHEAAAAQARQVDATLEDVSLAFPEDINQELLEGLLQELPVQTGEFSGAVQRIASGHGSVGDLNAAKRAAHTLKGAANTVGVRGIANLTHHLEDILISLSTEEVMPNRALAETLIHASDCLEAMSEAVTGVGREPDDALAVLQEVLNWAHRIDHEGVPEREDASDAAPTLETSNATLAIPAAAPVGAGGPMVRVPAALIDELLRLAGETIISTGQIRDRLAKLARHNQGVREQAATFLRLTNELEELVDIGASAGPVRARDEHAEFDPLEFEHYSELHTVSRCLIESATDAREMGLSMEEDLGELRELAEAQERLHQQTQGVVMQTRMVPASTVVSRLHRGVRQASRLLDKDVTLHVMGAETLIDSNILNELIDPLMHVLRNAVDHGIEPASVRTSAGKPATGHIELAFVREGNQVVARCRDDGAGLDFAAIRRAGQEKGLITPEQTLSDDELSRLILAPGFSTRDEATQVSGRGIGMDIVRSRIQQMKGSLSLHSQPSKGLTVELRLPAALISTHALIVRSGDKRLAVSSHGIQDIHYVMPDQLQAFAGSPTYRIGDSQLQVVELESLVGLAADRRSDPRGGFPVLIVRLDTGALHAVKVQEVLNSRNLVVKALGRYVPKLRGVVGATILGDGSVASVIDLPEMMATPVQLPRGLSPADTMRENYSEGASARLTALVVDDSLSARRATAQFMKDAGFEVRAAIDGLEAVSILEKWTPDVMLIDMEMPRMNGLELTSHVRASTGALAAVPIIMITSRSTAKHRKQAESAGVSVYLTKPFSDEELLRHVSQLTMA